MNPLSSNRAVPRGRQRGAVTLVITMLILVAVALGVGVKPRPTVLDADALTLIARDKAHVVAMTGSYFRGDSEAVLSPEDEAKFEPVTYTYYEQLNGYEHLKYLDIGYFFYSGSYADDILKVLDPNEKTILHIPNVNSRESTKDKHKEVEHIIDALGDWQGTDPATGFQLVKRPDGKLLRIADLVDDDPTKRDKVSSSLKDPSQKNNRDHVDIIIALGMAKEGFDWIWCEHALTVGYRSSLTEIIQIIGRATRDAPGKTRARFTNLIAEPAADDPLVVDAINDYLKAIAASLLMEQVLAPTIRYAREGHPVAPVIAMYMERGLKNYERQRATTPFDFTNARATYFKEDRAPRPGELPVMRSAGTVKVVPPPSKIVGVWGISPPSGSWAAAQSRSEFTRSRCAATPLPATTDPNSPSECRARCPRTPASRRPYAA